MIGKANVNISEKCVSPKTEANKDTEETGQVCWVDSVTTVLHRWLRNLPHLVLQAAHITKSDNGICLEMI